MARHGVSAAERRRISADLARLSRAGEVEAQRIVKRLYDRVKGLTPEEALRVLQAEMPAAADAIAKAIEKKYADAALAGAGRAAAGLGLGSGWKEAADALAATYGATGGIQLSAAIHGRSLQLLRGVESAVTGAIANGRSALDLAQRLRDDVRSLPGVRLTQRIEEMRRRVRAAAAAAGNPRAARVASGVLSSLDKYAAKLQRTPFGMGATTEHLAGQIRQAIERGNDAMVDEAIRWWTYDKQSYHQRMIARTEMARGYTEGFKRNADVPWVVGFKWNLESGARRYDICDMYAGQNLYGLGEGVYPFDKVPSLPAHPNCQCWLEEHIDDDVTEDDTRPPAPPQRTGATEAWLRRQPASTQREILGASGYERFRRSQGRELPGRLRV